MAHMIILFTQFLFAEPPYVIGGSANQNGVGYSGHAIKTNNINKLYVFPLKKGSTQ